MKTLTLEVSLKPFYGLDSASTRAACRRALQQWDALIDQADELAIMLWAADGSEILDYAGSLDAPMEWARYFGNANAHMPIPADPERKSLHAGSYLYRPDADLITYRRLAEIVQAWRDAAAEIGRSKIELGATFDPGGEFAPSRFKYERHREICLSDTMGRASFVCCYATLHGDNHAYAGFPRGIPEGTSLGHFLGCQFRHFARDLGFDFLWLSNGFGFGLETWKTIGPLFDGEGFHPEHARKLSDRILDFWRDFRRECPDLDVRTRGTNLGTGTDLASDATPLRDLYAGKFDFAPPPNSPWAAINGDFGIELAGYQSRIAELPPGRDYPFRFYLHDPWWLNSPWIDRYEGQPHDIYLPLAISRIAADGTVQPPRDLALLTIDDSHGAMPDRVPAEATPHLLRAWRERPDASGPFVWLYPFDELHDALHAPDPDLSRLFHCDWFVREALNHTLPVNTVVSTRAFDLLVDRSPHVLAGRILISPTPLSPAGEARLARWLDAGGALVLYGPLDHAPNLRNRLGLHAARPLEGRFTVHAQHPSRDVFASAEPTEFEHRPVMSGGGLGEAPADPLVPGTEVPVLATRDGETRALMAAAAGQASGRLTWLRGPLPLRVSPEEHLPTPDSPAITYPLTELVRLALLEHGWHLAIKASERTQRHPVLTLHRHHNGWFFSGYQPDTTVEIALRTPFGAPLLLGTEARIERGVAHYHLPRAWRHECRLFIDQTGGVASTAESCPAQVGVTRRLWLRGLSDATVRFFPPPNHGPVTLWLNPPWPHIGGERTPLRDVSTPHGSIFETTARVSGTLLLSW